MRSVRIRSGVLFLLLAVFHIQFAYAVPDDVTFSPAFRSGGLGIFSALQSRRDVTSYDQRLIDWEVLGNLLWAACGMNRPGEATRTIPVVTPAFTLRIVLLAEEGAWQYDDMGHRLVGIVSRDLRGMATAGGATGGSLMFPGHRIADEESEVDAPVVLLFAATEPFAGFEMAAQPVSQEEHLLRAAILAGHAAQNVHLVAAASDLGVQTLLPPEEREELARLLGISAPENILLVLRLGYPAAQ